jgi:hypothetical protein
MSFANFDRKKFALILFIGTVLLFSSFFYFDGREKTYEAGYNTARMACNEMLKNKTCYDKNPNVNEMLFNATNKSWFD